MDHVEIFSNLRVAKLEWSLVAGQSMISGELNDSNRPEKLLFLGKLWFSWTQASRDLSFPRSAPEITQSPREFVSTIMDTLKSLCNRESLQFEQSLLQLQGSPGMSMLHLNNYQVNNLDVLALYPDKRRLQSRLQIPFRSRPELITLKDNYTPIADTSEGLRWTYNSGDGVESKAGGEKSGPSGRKMELGPEGGGSHTSALSSPERDQRLRDAGNTQF